MSPEGIEQSGRGHAVASWSMQEASLHVRIIILKTARQARSEFELGGRGTKIGTIKEVNKTCVTCTGTTCVPKHVTIFFLQML